MEVLNSAGWDMAFNNKQRRSHRLWRGYRTKPDKPEDPPSMPNAHFDCGGEFASLQTLTKS